MLSWVRVDFGKVLYFDDGLVEISSLCCLLSDAPEKSIPKTEKHFYVSLSSLLVGKFI